MAHGTIYTMYLHEPIRLTTPESSGTQRQGPVALNIGGPRSENVLFRVWGFGV